MCAGAAGGWVVGGASPPVLVPCSTAHQRAAVGGITLRLIPISHRDGNLSVIFLAAPVKRVQVSRRHCMHPLWGVGMQELLLLLPPLLSDDC